MAVFLVPDAEGHFGPGGAELFHLFKRKREMHELNRRRLAVAIVKGRTAEYRPRLLAEMNDVTPIALGSRTKYCGVVVALSVGLLRGVKGAIIGPQRARDGLLEVIFRLRAS